VSAFSGLSGPGQSRPQSGKSGDQIRAGPIVKRLFGRRIVAGKGVALGQKQRQYLIVHGDAPLAGGITSFMHEISFYIDWISADIFQL
jgi:hypothetical protein